MIYARPALSEILHTFDDIDENFVLHADRLMPIQHQVIA